MPKEIRHIARLLTPDVIIFETTAPEECWKDKRSLNSKKM